MFRFCSRAPQLRTDFLVVTHHLLLNCITVHIVEREITDEEGATLTLLYLNCTYKTHNPTGSDSNTMPYFGWRSGPLSSEGRANAEGSVRINRDQPLGIAAARPSGSKRAQINADVCG